MGPTAEEVRRQQSNQVLTSLVWYATPGRTAVLEHQIQEQVLRTDGAVRRVLDEQMTLRLVGLIAGLWERGWQPADLGHVVRRNDPRAAGLLALAITEQAGRTAAQARAPQAWSSQLRVLADEAQDAGLAPAGEAANWLAADAQIRAGHSPAQAWVSLLVLAAQLERLPPLERLVDPPSAWSRAKPQQAAPAPDSDRAKLYSRIRALLAKAEATEYAAEAEAFTAKAQDLMSRHAIDEALLHARDDTPVGVSGVRIHLQSPYAAEKVQLLNAVGAANRCRTIYLQQLAMATVVGTPLDLDQVELLFTSLLIQAVRAMAEAGAVRAGSFDRSASFRRSFLVSYAVRIGERLQEADEEAVRSYGAELVPVLGKQAEAVDREFDRLFPRTRQRNVSRYSARGWEAGRAAADQAVLAAGRLTADSHR